MKPLPMPREQRTDIRQVQAAYGEKYLISQRKPFWVKNQPETKIEQVEEWNQFDRCKNDKIDQLVKMLRETILQHRNVKSERSII